MTDATVAGLSVTAAVQSLTRRFAAAGFETPSLDARLLVAAAAGLEQTALIASPDRMLGGTAAAIVDAYAQRRLAREPVSRIVGRRWFYGLEFEIGPATLDPRPDTETLVAGVLQRLRERDPAGRKSVRILDLGTGSGAILIAILASWPSATGLGVDRSAAALAVASRNACRLGAGDRAAFRESDWFSRVDGIFDVVVSNPPYIGRGAIPELEPDVRDYDPRGALDGGIDGLDAYRAIVAAAPEHLSPGGLLVLEVGYDQADAVTVLCRQTAILETEPDTALWRDLAGHRRCVAAKSLLQSEFKENSWNH